MSRQKATRAWNAAAGSGVAYTSAVSRLDIVRAAWSSVASMPPSRMALATMHSVSSTLARPEQQTPRRRSLASTAG